MLSSPTVGGALRARAGVAPSLIGMPGRVSVPSSGCSTSIIISRALTCAESVASATVATADDGIPAAASRVEISSVGSRRVQPRTMSSSASTWASRSACPRNRGSSASAGSPIAAASRGNRASVLACR
ncbi:hypothetical protein AFB00_21605 [Pseudonocardia sp. HH130630-07]|nr:hypothetical protein AFB00_21605 [Pseudonocardia sp. HH130630-07]